MLGHATILRWRTALCVSSDRHKHEMKLLARFFRRPRIPQPRRVSTPRRFLDMTNRPPYRGRTPGLARLPERLPSIHKKVETALALMVGVGRAAISRPCWTARILFPSRDGPPSDQGWLRARDVRARRVLKVCAGNACPFGRFVWFP